LHLQEDHFIAEVIDPRSGETLPEGSQGELVLTTITKEGFPLIRYRTGDLTALTTEACPCGRTLARMRRTAGRTDDLIITRGIKFFPSQIEELLLQIEGFAPHLQIVLTSRGGMDEMELKVEISERHSFDEIRSLETFRNRIAASVEQALGLQPKVTLVEPRSLRPAGDRKARPFVDRRSADTP
jgi:phenylacetate-CoA ligase